MKEPGSFKHRSRMSFLLLISLIACASAFPMNEPPPATVNLTLSDASGETDSDKFISASLSSIYKSIEQSSDQLVDPSRFPHTITLPKLRHNSFASSVATAEISKVSFGKLPDVSTEDRDMDYAQSIFKPQVPSKPYIRQTQQSPRQMAYSGLRPKIAADTPTFLPSQPEPIKVAGDVYHEPDAQDYDYNEEASIGSRRTLPVFNSPNPSLHVESLFSYGNLVAPIPLPETPEEWLKHVAFELARQQQTLSLHYASINRQSEINISLYYIQKNEDSKISMEIEKEQIRAYYKMKIRKLEARYRDVAVAGSDVQSILKSPPGQSIKRSDKEQFEVYYGNDYLNSEFEENSIVDGEEKE